MYSLTNLDIEQLEYLDKKEIIASLKKKMETVTTNEIPQFKNKSIISISQLTKKGIMHVLKHANELKKNPQPELLRGHVMASCFFEPSTRTRLSFESAMERLGGQVMGFADAGVTSAKKKESLYDSMKIIGQYADIIAMRHPLEGAARRAAEATDKPILNGGDGANQHPTQTLLDLFSILETQGTLENLHIALVGDLKYGRTVHSLAQALKHFDARLYFVTPQALYMPTYITKELKKGGLEVTEHERIEEIIADVDILYMTRIQAERFADQMEYEKIKDTYVLTADMLKNAKPTMKIMHPLPRVNEINTAVDTTRHAYYFEQAQNGLYVRQALLGLVLGKLS